MISLRPKIPLFERDERDLSVVLLRFAIGSIWLWFGLKKVFQPDMWLTRMPDLVIDLIPGRFVLWVALFGLLEAVIGLLLIAGRRVRDAAAAATLLTVFVILAVGADDLSVRDAGLLGASLALFVTTNARTARPLPKRAVAIASAIYIFSLFVLGLMFLRSPL